MTLLISISRTLLLIVISLWVDSQVIMDETIPKQTSLTIRLLSNVTFYLSKDRIVPIMDSFLSYFGPGNFTLDSVNSSIYATSNQLYPPIWLAISPYWIPSDSVQRQMSLNNISMTLKDNISKNRLSSIFFNYQIAGYTREIIINYSNGYHFDIQYSFYPILVIFVSPTVYVTSNF